MIPHNLKRDRVVRIVNDSVTPFISIADTTSKPLVLNLDKSLDCAQRRRRLQHSAMTATARVSNPLALLGSRGCQVLLVAAIKYFSP